MPFPPIRLGIATIYAVCFDAAILVGLSLRVALQLVPLCCCVVVRGV